MPRKRDGLGQPKIPNRCHRLRHHTYWTGKSWALTPQGTGSRAAAMKLYLPSCPRCQRDPLQPTQGYLLSGFYSSDFILVYFHAWATCHRKQLTNAMGSLSSSCPDPREPLLNPGHNNFSQQHGTTGTDPPMVPDLRVSLNLSRPRVSGERWALWRWSDPSYNRGQR